MPQFGQRRGVRDKLSGGASSENVQPERAGGSTQRVEPAVVSRRQLLMGVGGGATLLSASRALGSFGTRFMSAGSSSGTIVVGFVSPQTGDLADFATSNTFAVNKIRQTPSFSKGLRIGGKTYDVQIIVKDSQSDPSRASEVARQLILSDHVDMILTTSTPETTNPVSGVCQAQGMP